MSGGGADEPGRAQPDRPPQPGDASTPPSSAPDPWGPAATTPGAPSTDAWTVPAPEAAAGAPRRARGRAWLVALLAVLSLIVAMAVAGTVLFITRTLPPYNAARHFLDDVTHDRRAAAAAHLCSADAGSPEDIIQAVRSRVGGSIDSITANPLGVDRSGSTATVDFSVAYSDGRHSRTFFIRVREENGSWKACPRSG